MMVDEKDQGTRPAHEALLGLADKIDQERAAFRKEAAATIAQAESFVREKRFEAAALVFEEIAREAAEASLLIEANAFRQRAADAREAERFARKKARKAAGR